MPCAMPPLATASRDPNIFSPEQAAILGDIVLRHMVRTYKLVHDPALNAYAQRIADRMAEVAGTGPVRVDLLDLPEVNAITYPGGRIMLSRKLIAFARSEDEVAGVLAHEFGHVVARDAERGFSTALRRILNVTAVTDARDIEDKDNAVMDNHARKPFSVTRGESEEVQQLADALAVWLMARVGYAAKAYPEFWDRYNELQSDTGNWLGDFFDATKPASKRLRVALKAASSFPPGCLGTRTTTEQQFAEWQKSVIEASRAARATALHGVVFERKISPPLRTDLARLKFSPDGKWVLAQDDSSVYVFEREKLAYWFRFDATDAYPAQFSPDSSAIVFYDPNYRVERWNVASKQREWAHELALSSTGCFQTELSPDGLSLACATPTLGLRVYDVVGGAVMFEKDAFIEPTNWDLYILWLLTSVNPNPPFFEMHFSPDAGTLVVARDRDAIAVDLRKRQASSLPGSLRTRLGRAFAFMGNDRIVGIHIDKLEESAIVTFPQGEIVTKLKLAGGRVMAPTRGDGYVFVDARAPMVLAFVSTKENKVAGGIRTPGFDMYDDVYLSELRTGQIALQRVGEQTPMVVADVPAGPLGRLRTADVSPDFQVAALSLNSRGVIWDLTASKATLLRGFRGALVGQDRQVFLDFPAQDKARRAVVRMSANTPGGTPVVEIEAPRPANAPPPDPAAAAGSAPTPGAATVTATNVQQHGAFLVGVRAGAKKSDPSD